MIRHAALPVPTLAAILVIAVVPMNVPEGQRTTAVLMLQQPNAGQLVVTVKTVLPAVPHIPVHTPVLPNAVAVITAPIPVLPAQKAAFPVPETMSPHAFLLLNAAQDVTNVDTIQIVT